MQLSELLTKQINFIVETDKLKQILRRTSPISLSRRENSAEHSWQVVLCAIVFEQYANQTVDLLKVIKMLALHDIVEIDAGDTFHYDKSGTEGLYNTELMAAKRIFGLLPPGQSKEYLALWQEFEAKITPEAQYASAIDRIIAIVINSHSQGGNWHRDNVTVEKALEKNAHIKDGSEVLWQMAQELLQQSMRKGFIKP